jgi:hypothetical protein
LLPLFALIFGRWQYFTPVEKRLILLSLMPLLAMLGMACHSPFWHGTYGYGPRILAQALPWLSLMVVIATAHFLSTEANTAKDLSPSYDKSTGYWVFSARFKGFTAILVFWSVLINVYGTTQSKIMGWHVVSLTSLSLADRPTSLLDPRHQKVFWNWQDPVFLAGIVHPERYYSISIQEAKDKRLK